MHLVENPVRVLLLDDDPENLLLRAAILRKHGYLADTAGTIGEAEKLLNKIDIAVLDYHLGAGQFGTEVASVFAGAGRKCRSLFFPPPWSGASAG